MENGGVLVRLIYILSVIHVVAQRLLLLALFIGRPKKLLILLKHMVMNLIKKPCLCFLILALLDGIIPFFMENIYLIKI